MAAAEEIAEATEKNTGQKFYIKTENEADREDILGKIGVIGETAGSIAMAYPDNTTYVFRKMALDEFNLTKDAQKLLKPLTTNPRKGEKWITESISHSKGYQNRGRLNIPEGVAEIQVDKMGYKNIRDNAITQYGSKAHQPREGPLINVYNKERLLNEPNKLNIGLKGHDNVDAFNRHVVNISKVDPNSFMNKNKVVRWIRRHKLQTAGIAIGIAIDTAHIIISVISDDGSFGKSTQFALGNIAGGMLGAEMAAVIGAQIGAALGSIVPVWGNIILGFLGGLIGSLVGGSVVELARYLFCVSPVAPGPGVPILDTDPYPTYHGVPDNDLETNATGYELQEDTGAIGIPSMGLQTGAKGVPKSEYKTRRK